MSENSNKSKLEIIREFKERHGLSMIKSLKAERQELEKYIEYLSKEHPPIEAVWADESNFWQAPFFSEYCILDANVKTLIQNSNFDCRKIVHESSQLKHRHIQILKRWINKEPIDPPICNYSKEIEILEGNHRIALCDFLEISRLQIIVPKESVDKFIGSFNFELHR